MKKFPKEIQELIERRILLRKEKKFQEADKVRNQLKSKGYIVTDTDQGVEVANEHEYMQPAQAFLALFGSGEISPSSVQTHEQILAGIEKDNPSIVILSTPAGFQPNVTVVCEEIRDFFQTHLQNHHPQVHIVYANTLEDCNNPTLIQPIATADYIFAGPGSPTYAVRSLQSSLLCQKVVQRAKQGASIGLASAATMAFSRFCLPVYEIFKAGFLPYWEDGLNVYSHIFKELTVISHFNNNEGGAKNDTSYAWMGKKRFEHMLSLLPKEKCMWGIDEHTSALINLQTQNVQILGKGNVWEIQGGKTTPLKV